MMAVVRAPPRMCGSCPYRRDVPAGVWAASEYRKLADYDKPTPLQPPHLFMCHQNDGCLCGGWLMTHDRDHLLALRIGCERLHPNVFSFTSSVAVFATGAEAAAHGMSGIDEPFVRACQMVEALVLKRARKGEGLRMTPDRLRECLDIIGWTAQQLARQLDSNERQVRRMVAGASRVPPPVADWLEVLVRLHEDNPPPAKGAAPEVRDEEGW